VLLKWLQFSYLPFFEPVHAAVAAITIMVSVKIRMFLMRGLIIKNLSVKSHCSCFIVMVFMAESRAVVASVFTGTA
jgi:hypothetical protein